MGKMFIVAFEILLSRKKLLFIGALPAVLTLLFTIFGGAYLWSIAFVNFGMVLKFFATGFSILFLWLSMGNVCLLMVEDIIVDECQAREWGSIRVPSRGMSARRVFKNIFFSVLLAFTGVLLAVLSFLPFLTPICLLISALFISFNFTNAFLSRLEPNNRKRLRRFLTSWFSYWILGVVLYLMLFFPLLNIFMLGYAQILATLVSMRIERFDLASGSKAFSS